MRQVACPSHHPLEAVDLCTPGVVRRQGREGDGADDYDLWVAHYYWPQVTSPTIPAGWMKWKIWQHSNKGRVPGISASSDLNFFGGTMEELAAYAGGSPPPTLEKRVQNLERWAGELDTWARTQGYGGVGPRG